MTPSANDMVEFLAQALFEMIEQEIKTKAPAFSRNRCFINKIKIKTWQS
jgi:hypothetical protein